MNRNWILIIPLKKILVYDWNIDGGTFVNIFSASKQVDKPLTHRLQNLLNLHDLFAPERPNMNGVATRRPPLH